MADNPIENLRLSLMQEVLPVGIAMLERARKGGANKVVEVFTSADDPLQILRKEGEPAAQTIRERLDEISPGLGNPVVPVEIAVDTTPFQDDEEDLDYEPLMHCLGRIHQGMEELEMCLFEDCGK